MPPRARNGPVIPQLAEPSAPSPPSLPTQWPRSRPLTRTDTHQDSEHFDLENVSGSDEEEEGPRGDGARDAVLTSVEDGSMNDPDAILMKGKSTAADIHYFFNRSGLVTIC